ncbi:MAG: TolC family protein, partial [Planctomycetes bacterium]|nr:TolC family protein [Planctomycetota bacterium]
MARQHGKLLVACGVAASLLAGCIAGEKSLQYLGEAQVEHYKSVAAEIDYPHQHEPLPDTVRLTDGPRTVWDRTHDEVRDISLQESFQIALMNNSIIRSRAQFLSPANTMYTNSDLVPSIYDPAIQASGFLFFGRGLESALSAFDAQFATTMFWGRNETPLNLPPTPGVPSSAVDETGAFSAALTKQFASGGLLSVAHTMNYLGSNASGLMFPSSYTGTVRAEYRHPLWAGAGTEFTRIAGPIAQSFRGITGTDQGVVIARINHDLTLADFEASVRNLVKDVEDLYWELYLKYRVYDTAVTARNSALITWREAKAKLEVGGVQGFRPADEAQARDRYFETRAQTEAALADLYTTEISFRRLLGMPVNDGTILRPSDEPVTAEFVPDWKICLVEALTRRVELRKQKWKIKSLELQLKAARSLTRPRLDLVAGYRINGFGDKLFAYNDNDGFTSQGFRSAYGTITQGDHTGWDIGFELSMPIGFRAAHAQVRNLELRLAKARDVLATQEMEISHELAAVFESLAANYVTAQSNFDRRRAAQERVRLFEAEVRAGTLTFDELLRAQASLADAETAYYTSLVRYNQAIADLHFRKGTLLEYNHIYLAEGDWTPEAYRQALRRAFARAHAWDDPHLKTVPEDVEQECFDCELPESYRLGGGADELPVEAKDAGQFAPPPEPDSAPAVG